MSVCLLDVNVLVALFDPAHVHHDPAHEWFARHRKNGWATCPHTINDCVRVLSNPAYPTVQASPAEVLAHLRVFCASPHHEFWADSVSLLDETLFHAGFLAGHRMVTDAYLLGLSVRRHGRLATFDATIPLRAVVDATAKHLEVIR